MIKIGLTGSIAVGKSFVLSIFKTEYNVPVFSSDECVRGIYRHNADLNNFIKDEILASDNQFSNEDIANIVFKDSIKLEKLEKKNNNLEYKILELTTLLRNHGIVNKTNKKLEESKDVNDDNEEERNPSVVPDKEGTTSNSAENNTSMESIEYNIAC